MNILYVLACLCSWAPFHDIEKVQGCKLPFMDWCYPSWIGATLLGLVLPFMDWCFLGIWNAEIIIPQQISGEQDSFPSASTEWRPATDLALQFGTSRREASGFCEMEGRNSQLDRVEGLASLRLCVRVARIYSSNLFETQNKSM